MKKTAKKPAANPKPCCACENFEKSIVHEPCATCLKTAARALWTPKKD